MNLKSFANFQPFNKLRSEMGASKLGTFDVGKPVVAKPDAAPEEPPKKSSAKSSTKKAAKKATKNPVKKSAGQNTRDSDQEDKRAFEVTGAPITPRKPPVNGAHP